MGQFEKGFVRWWKVLWPGPHWKAHTCGVESSTGIKTLPCSRRDAKFPHYTTCSNWPDHKVQLTEVSESCFVDMNYRRMVFEKKEQLRLFYGLEDRGNSI